MKRLMQSLLLLVVASSLVFWAWGRAAAPRPIADGPDPGAGLTVITEHVVVVTYFSSDQRCRACLEIEALTRQALDQAFAAEMQRGRVQFRVLNLDRPDNARYLSAYALSFKTVVISDWHNGEEANWRRMDRVWFLRAEPAASADYLAEQVRAYLDA